MIQSGLRRFNMEGKQRRKRWIRDELWSGGGGGGEEEEEDEG